MSSGFIKRREDLTYRGATFQNESKNKWFPGRPVNLQVPAGAVESDPTGFVINWPGKELKTYVSQNYVEPKRLSPDDPYVFCAPMDIKVYPGKVTEIYTGVCAGIDAKHALVISLPQKFTNLFMVGNAVIYPTLLNSREDGGQIIIRLGAVGDIVNIHQGEAYLEAIPFAVGKMVNGNEYVEE